MVIDDGTTGWVDGSTPDGAKNNSDAVPVRGSVDTATETTVIAWIGPHQPLDMETAELPSGPELAGYGPVMFCRLTVVTGADGLALGLSDDSSNVVRLATGTAARSSGSLPSANDNAVWVGDENGTGSGGVIGRDAQATALISGETIVTWVGLDGQLQGKAYGASGTSTVDGSADGDTDTLGPLENATEAKALAALLKDIAPLAPDQRYRLVETGRDGFAVLWAATIAGVLVLTGRHFKPDGEGSDSIGWVSQDIAPTDVKPGFAFTSDFAVLGWSADDGGSIFGYSLGDGDGSHVQAEAHSQGDLVEVSFAEGVGSGASPQATGNSTRYVVVLKDTTQAGLIGDAATTAPAAALVPAAANEDAGTPISIHEGIVDVAGTGGKVLVGGSYEERDGVAGLSEGDAVTHTDDLLEGTAGDDVIIGDLPDSDPDPEGAEGCDSLDGPIAGGDDHLSGGVGDDVIYGGGGDDVVNGGGDDTHSDGGGDDAHSDGGASRQPSIDTAIFSGNDRDYSITANGDGTYTVILARSDTGDSIDHEVTGFEGVDTSAGIEQYQFLNGDIDYVVRLVNGADISTLATSGHGVVLGSDLFQLPGERNEDLDQPDDGTPLAWGLTRDGDGQIENTIVVVTSAGDRHCADTPVIEAPVVAATGDGGFAVGWVEDGQLAIKVYDALGRAEGTTVSIDAGESRSIDSDLAPVMDTAGYGVAVAWVSTDTISNQHDEHEHDPNHASEAVGPSYISVQLVGHEGGTGEDDTAPTVTVSIEAGTAATGLDLAGDSNSSRLTLTWVQSDDAAGNGNANGGNGDIVVQRFAVSVDDGGSDGHGRTTISAVDLDGSTDHGGGPTVIGTGHSAAVTATADDGFAVVWVADDGAGPADAAAQDHIEGRVFSSVGFSVETFVLPIEEGRSVREGTRPTIDTTGDGSIAITWQEVSGGSSALSVMSALLRSLDDGGWSAPIIRELRQFDDAPGEISVTVAGNNGDALILTWRTDGEGGGEITGQRFSVEALGDSAANAAMGVSFEIAGSANSGSDGDNCGSGGGADCNTQDCEDGTSGPGNGGYDHSGVIGLDDGRVIVVMRETTSGEGAAPEVSIQIEMFDTRDANDVIISVDSGAGSDDHVGTVGDDIIDGRAGQDDLFGGLGDDTLTAGTGDDSLEGGEGNDSLLGGSGSDQLHGGAGDDLLMGGFGRDSISGGDGEDTVSYRGETRDVTVDLDAGTVRSDANHNAVDDGAEGGAGLEDILADDIENIEGGLGDDRLLGDSGDNVITGGKGDDAIDGRGGHDTVRYSGSSADYEISLRSDGAIEVKHTRNTSGAANDGTDQLTNIEELAFADGLFALNSDGTLAASSIAAALGIASEISIAAIECFDFVELSALDGDDGLSCNKGSGSSGSESSGTNSGSWSAGPSLADDLCGFGSDTLYFGDLDALIPNNSGKGSGNQFNCDLDDLDFSSCTVFATQIEIEAALESYGDSDQSGCLGSLWDSDCFDLKPLDYLQN